MFQKIDGNQMIQIMFQVVKAIRIKRNPVTGRPLITNVWTQILANRVLTLNAEWKQDGVKEPIRIEVQNFAPSRDPRTGVFSKDLTPSIKAEYELGLPEESNPLQEFGYLLTYFTACFATGQLPTPAKLSGQSTIMSKIVQTWREDKGLTPLWIESVAKTGVVKRMNTEHINIVQSVFVQNFDSIVNEWNSGESRDGKVTNRIEWI